MAKRFRIRCGLAVSAFLFVALASNSGNAAAVAPGGARQLAEAWLLERGAEIGFDAASNRLLVLESAAIGQPPTSPLFLIARQAAFASAMQSARQAAAEFLAAEIATSITSKTSMSEVLADPQLAQAITKAAAGSTEYHKSLENMVSVVARVAVSGLAPWQTFESADAKGGEIAVIASLSDKYASVARGERVKLEPKATIQSQIRSFDDDTLAATIGTRVMRNETGNLVAVGFGQGRVRTGPGTATVAKDEARIAAEGALALLRGEQVASQKFHTELSELTIIGELPETFQSSSEFDEEVAANCNASGIQIRPIASRTVTHPATGDKVWIEVCEMSFNQGGEGNAPAMAAAVQTGDADCPEVPAKMQNAVRQLRVKGLGVSRATAIAAALFEAVRQEGAMVKGDSKLEKRFAEAMESVGDEVKEKASASTVLEQNVKSFANGFVYSYAVISESKIGEGIEVELCANLVRFDPKNPRFGLPPTVVMIQLPSAADPTDEQREATALFESVLEKALFESGSFQYIEWKDEHILSRLRDDIARKVLGGESEVEEALKLGRALTADFVLVSRVDAKFVQKDPTQIGASDRATAVASAKLVNVASSEITWVDSANVALKGRDILLVRAGRDLQDPQEKNLSPPDQLAAFRAAREMSKSLLAKCAKIKAEAAAESAQSTTKGKSQNQESLKPDTGLGTAR